MAFTLKDLGPNQTEHKIDLGEDGDLTLTLRRPTAREVMHEELLLTAAFAGQQDDEHQGRHRVSVIGNAFAEQSWLRISTVVVGWSGVTDEAGKPVKFSLDSLQSLMLASPEFADQVYRLARTAFQRANAKNFAGPSVSSSTDEPAKEPPSEPTSAGETSPSSPSE